MNSDITALIARHMKSLPEINNRHRAADEIMALWFKDEIRIVKVKDETYDINELKGDTFKVEHNPNIDLADLKIAEYVFEQRIQKQGVYGVVGQYKDSSGEWRVYESVWGFVGNDYLSSGHEEDIARATLEMTPWFKATHG